MAYYNTKSDAKRRGKAMKQLILGKEKVNRVARDANRCRQTIWRWHKKWEKQNANRQLINDNHPNRPIGNSFRYQGITWDIPAESSRPHHHPKQISEEICKRVIELRYAGKTRKKKQCAELIWFELRKERIYISLHSVRRILKRAGMYQPEKNHYHPYEANDKRPTPEKPGDLIEIDTIHLINPLDAARRIYVFTIIDIYTRMAYAYAAPEITQKYAKTAISKAKDYFGFDFKMVQSDNGSEYKSEFRKHVQKIIKAKYRHTRKCHPNDNAHIERFNRTLREECIGEYSSKSVAQINNALQTYINYYNYDRIHLGLQHQWKEFLTPAEMLHR